MEKGDGTMVAVEFRNRGQLNGLMSIDALAAVFQREVMPSTLEVASRVKYHGMWCAFVTFGLAHRDLECLMPAKKETVQAFVQEMLMLGASASYIQAAIAAIQSRHRDYGFPEPLLEKMSFHRMMKAVSSLRGAPKRLIHPLTKSHLRRMMRLKDLSLTQERDVVLTVTGTQLLCRVGEVSRLQVCDMLKDHDTAFSRQYRGSAAFRIRKRKQDQRRKGLYPRIAKGRRPQMCTVTRIERLLARNGSMVSPFCTKGQHPAARCIYCPPFFQSARLLHGVSRELSRQQVTGAVQRSLKLIGVDSSLFSGISMRRGGISTAIHAKVLEPVLFLQSGHGSGTAARAYMVPLDPSLFFETAQALRL